MGEEKATNPAGLHFAGKISIVDLAADGISPSLCHAFELVGIVAHCHLRGAQRVFVVDRIESLAVSEQRPNQPDFEIPPEFDAGEVARRRPWQWVGSAPAAVARALTGSIASVTTFLLSSPSFFEFETKVSSDVLL